jgi:hypothetical protein
MMTADPAADVVQPLEFLAPLFEKAKTVDEFEYCSTLLRIRGAHDSGWDPLEESSELAHQVLGLAQVPIDGRLRTRLLIFLYCHLTEMDDLYAVVANLLRVCRGERYSMLPFDAALHPSKKTAKRPQEKTDRIAEWAAAEGFPEIAWLFETLLMREVRNAFDHSDYVLTNSTFNIIRGEPVRIGGLLERRVEMSWLGPRLQLGINTGTAVMRGVIDRLRSYTENRVINGRLGPGGTVLRVELLTDPAGGLVGFRSPPAGDPLIVQRP